MKIFTHLFAILFMCMLFSCSSQNKMHDRYKDFRNQSPYANAPYYNNNGRYVNADANANKYLISKYPSVFNNNNAVTYYVLPNTFNPNDPRQNQQADKVVVLNNDGGQGKTYIVIKGNNNNNYRQPYYDDKHRAYNNYDNKNYRDDNNRNDNVIIIVQ